MIDLFIHTVENFTNTPGLDFKYFTSGHFFHHLSAGIEKKKEEKLEEL